MAVEREVTLSDITRAIEQRNPQLADLVIAFLDQADAIELAGTEDATTPFFSPDGEWIAFFAENKLKKVSVQGG